MTQSFDTGLLVGFIRVQIQSCIFPAFFFALLLISKFIPAFLPRYDFLLIGCLAVQYLMWKTGLESTDEVKVVFLFHLIGLGLELFKVHYGSWSYPEIAYSKWRGVPLYSGFMYASVASYICQAWKRMHLRISGLPRNSWNIVISALIYINFFSHHFIPDLRWVLILLLLLLYRKTYVNFTILTGLPTISSSHILAMNNFSGWRIQWLHKSEFKWKMPLILSFFLIGLFIWLAENIATGLGAWMYPHQRDGWEMVHLSKISSWLLLVIISIVIVVELKRYRYPEQFEM